MSKEIPQRSIVLWIISAFALWVYIFIGFLSAKFRFSTSDASSYYDHIKFLIENIGHGVYPLWDPFWFYGAPNDFFLRRICAFNPFYFIILVFKFVGLPYILSYLCFLALYYWGGMVAFYLLVMRVYHDRFMAYAGYLILLFSALGTRLFDSYLMLVTVPVIWFFYFVVAFTQTSRKCFFLGMILSLMILLGTYIPLYFLIILGLFLFIFSLIYFDYIPKIFSSYLNFTKKNKIFVLISILGLLLSFIPIIIFFHNSALGQVVLPARHGDVGLGHTLIVPRQNSNWGAVEALMYSAFFSDLRQYKFEIVYVPFFSVILFVLGLMGRINRRGVFLVLLGVSLFCIIVPHGLPFYDFLYQHTFVLKYFRNLHFFIWFFLIPLFVLLVVEHWKMFIEIKITNSLGKWLLLLFVLSVHVLAFLFVWYRKDAIFSTYLTIFLSFIFWLLMPLRLIKPNFWGLALLTLTIVVQPLEVYHYLSLKASAYVGYEYDFSYSTLKLKIGDLFALTNALETKSPLYYASGGINFIYQNINNYALTKYLQNRFIMVDRVQFIDPKEIDPALIEHNFLTGDNTAIIFNKTGEGMKLAGDDPNPSPKAMPIDNNSKGFKVLSFNANDLRLAMDLDHEKFLIYNDSYDPNWRVSINHRQASLYEVNGAFKGVWVPAGKSMIEFSYGSWWQYAINILLSIFAFLLLLGIIWYAYFSSFCEGQSELTNRQDI